MDALHLEGQPKQAYVHTLSLRLTDHDYRKLRKFVADQEERLGQRLTHQAVLEAALCRFLQREQATVANIEPGLVTATSDKATNAGLV